MSEFDRNLPLGGQNVRHLVSVVGALPILDCDFGDPSEGFLRRTGIPVAVSLFIVLPFLGIIVLVWIVAYTRETIRSESNPAFRASRCAPPKCSSFGDRSHKVESRSHGCQSEDHTSEPHSRP